MRVEEALAKYVVQLRADGRSGHTVRQYERHVLLLARWMGEAGMADDVCALTHEEVARFLTSAAATTRPDGRPKRATAMNALRSSVRTFFGYLAATGATSRPRQRVQRRTWPPTVLRGSGGPRRRAGWILKDILNRISEEAANDLRKQAL